MKNMDSFKYLGIEIDKKLNFINQTEKICKKVSNLMVLCTEEDHVFLNSH